MPAKPRSVDIKMKSDRMGYACQYLRVEAAAGEGPAFSFRNKTRLQVQVNFLRDDLVYDENNHLIPGLAVGPGQTSPPLLVNTKLGPGIYEYEVLLPAAEIEAEGGSRPGIEIAP